MPFFALTRATVKGQTRREAGAQSQRGSELEPAGLPTKATAAF